MASKSETFGSPISDISLKQLRAREAVLKKPNKSIEELEIINSNTAWVSLRSSVNRVENVDQISKVRTGKAKPSTLSHSHDIAKQFVLFGGTRQATTNSFYGDGSARAGVNFDKENFDPLKAYNYDNITGYRPMPGITSVKVASKNTYGTLLTAEVSFNVWSLSDLEKCELLYFRPGYSALLEWGHTHGFSYNETPFKAGIDYRDIPDGDFFQGPNSTTVDSNIAQTRRDSHGNYEAMFGFITNFSWSFRSDGGYDCSVKIVSRNIVLESIKNAPTRNMTEDEIEKAEQAEEKDRDERKSTFHYIFEAAESFTDEIQGNISKVLKKGKKNATAKRILEEADFDFFRIKRDIKGFGIDESVNMVWIPLRALLSIFNAYESIKNSNGDKVIEFDLSYGEKFTTFDQHFSIDVGECVLPAPPKGDKFSFRHVTVEQIGTKMETYAKANGGVDDILNIMVTTRFVKQELDKVLEQPVEEGTGLYDVFRNILARIEDNLGGINNLDIVTTSAEGSNKEFLRIVDRLNTQYPKAPVLNLTGLSGTMLDINLSSKITSAVSSQVAIAAQGSAGNYKENVSAILKWNEGAIDRHFPIKDQKPGGNQKSLEEIKAEAEKAKKYQEDLEDTWIDFNKGGDGYFSNSLGQQYDPDLFNKIRSNQIADITLAFNLDEKNANKGVVPVELTLKMMGVSGLKIGQSFKVKPGLLPSKYDKYAYIITGLEHEINTDNKWVTTVKTQFYASAN